MPYYLLLSRSITHAQRMSSALGKIGILTRIFRPPVGLSDKGCSYAVSVAASEIESAIDRLRETGLLPVKVFYSAGDGAYREIGMR